MKTIPALKSLVVAALATLFLNPCARAAEDIRAVLASTRATYQMDRRIAMTESLALTDPEAAAFFPLYQQYRAEVDRLGDGLVKVVLEYADAYPNVPADRARRLLKEYTALEEKLAKTRAAYVRRAGKLIPPAKALRWAQVENRMDLMLRLQLASVIPLVPVNADSR